MVRLEQGKVAGISRIARLTVTTSCEKAAGIRLRRASGLGITCAHTACNHAVPIQPHTLMKTKDTRKETKKLPTKTAKEKKLAKQAKKNDR